MPFIVNAQSNYIASLAQSSVLTSLFAIDFAFSSFSFLSNVNNRKLFPQDGSLSNIAMRRHA